MTETSDEPNRTSRAAEAMDDFRATATAFSQLTGVLGGFSMTILVLVLTLSNEGKGARDWTVALLLIGAMAYICAAGILANSMNAGRFARLSRNSRTVLQYQHDAFNIGIMLFHIGNIFLPIAIVVTVYQESLLVGLIASIAIFLLTMLIVVGNFLVPRFNRIESIETGDESKRAQTPTGNGLGWPS